ncbi:competence/damage-inducible protein A [Chloroflexota bacterium]
MKAEIISVGTELLLGETTDTNASYLAFQLQLLGIDLYWVTQVGDNRSRMVDVLRCAWSRSEFIITTGGLGPTEDDLMRETIAELFGEEMKVDPELEQMLRDRFHSMDVEMPRRNVKQANLIPSACTIPNSRGSAPGWWVEREGRVILSMPGPPGEMQHMWANNVIPKLRGRLSGDVIASRTLKTWGLGEAMVDEMVSPLLSSTNPSIGLYARPDGVQLRITAKADSSGKAQVMIDAIEARVRDILDQNIWGVDKDTMESIVGTLLREKGLSLAVMESCTGGLLASTITDAPGSSDYFRGGLVSYSAETKIAFGVDPELLTREGTVSLDVAVAMAKAVRHILSSDIGIGVTGVAGPTETEGKAVGIVHIAIDSKEGKRVLSATYPPYRLDVKRRAIRSALFELRQLLLGGYR